ncbi:hypothetical protein AB0G04_02575 [Actinoplanes sp. NPDC023801]|uniref:hypothetical protein n=1 Tax=Actinoplanes sp. NPDC023801 TaxID=3154595 RepID=UPI0033C57A3D
MSPLVVGPRSLSAAGVVEVWIDTGSGPGYTAPVPVSQLSLAPLDNGQGSDAIYRLNPVDVPAPAGQERSTP